MHGATSGLRTVAARLAELERERPEWQAWLRLLGEAERVLDDASWRAPFVEGVLGDPTARSAGAPLLHGRTLGVDADQLQRLVHRLVSAAITPAGNVTGAESLKRYQPSAADGVALLAAAVRQDGEALGRLATAAGVNTGALTSLAHLAALPLLQSCGRLVEEQVPRFWPHGHCPVCGAWPTLVERRGLDRTRRLRCGRCAAGWEVQWLCCIYCGEREHEQLGSLVSDDRGEMLKVETCTSCRGYLKSVATLQEIPSFELLLQDLETVELDLVALELGYGRPEERGFPLDVRIIVVPASGAIWRDPGNRLT